MPSILIKWLTVGVFLLSVSACKNEETNTASVTPEVNVVMAGKQNLPTYSEYVG